MLSKLTKKEMMIIAGVALFILMILASALDRPKLFYKIGGSPSADCLTVVLVNPKNGSTYEKSCADVSWSDKLIAETVAVPERTEGE